MATPTESGYYWQNDIYSGWIVLYVDENLDAYYSDDCWHNVADIPGRWSTRLLGPDEK